MFLNIFGLLSVVDSSAKVSSYFYEIKHCDVDIFPIFTNVVIVICNYQRLIRLLSFSHSNDWLPEELTPKESTFESIGV